MLLVMALWSGMSAAAGIPSCRDMDEKTYEQLLPRAIEFFIKAHKFPLGKVNISPGQDCGGSRYIIFEAKPEFNNPGYHWLVEIDKHGKISIINGI